MKFALFLPFVLLLGLIIGGWAPKQELRAVRKEADDLQAKLASGEKDSRLDMFTRMAKIPDRATKPASPSKAHPQAASVAQNRSNATNAVATAPAGATNGAVLLTPPDNKPRQEKLRPEDLQARIDEAKELWKTRVDVARAQWIDRLKLSADQTALFDETINTMNEQLYRSMQNFATELAASDTVTPETGIRAFNEMTSSLVQTYDSLNAIVPEGQSGETAKIELTDFIDPAVTEPLIAVQDKLENMPRGHAPVVRIGR
jgi:hypothetical protein